MAVIVRTGGNKDIVYSDEDLRRIETEDTFATAAFKKAYADYLEKQKLKQKRRELIRKTTYSSLIRILLLIALGLIIWSFFSNS